MKLRLLSVLLAATGLGGCVSYDYAGGSSGGYYHGRASVDYHGGYGGYGNYGGYGYGGYPAYGYGSRYYGSYGYSPYYRYYPYPSYYVVRPPHYVVPRPRGGRGRDHDDRGEKRPPPWRAPDGPYLDRGRTVNPARSQGLPYPGAPSQVLPAPARPRALAPPRSSAPSREREPRAVHSERPAPRRERASGIRREPN